MHIPDPIPAPMQFIDRTGLNEYSARLRELFEFEPIDDLTPSVINQSRVVLAWTDQSHTKG